MAFTPSDDILSGYQTLQHERPELFRNAEAGGIDILTEPDAIAAAQHAAMQVRRRRGQSVDDLRVGLLAQDPYMTIVRDAVRFPDRSLGLFNRLIEGRSVAILPMLGDRLVLMRLFRHGLRDWSLEFPRGGCDLGEDAETAARRELREEIGATARELIPLGDFTPGGSSLSTTARFFAARIDSIGEPDRSEAISTIDLISVAEAEAMIRDSRIIDGFTLSIFLRARLAGLI